MQALRIPRWRIFWRSGMNMAFLTGFVFALLRRGLALVPHVALRVNTKKVAAVVSLGVALFTCSVRCQCGDRAGLHHDFRRWGPCLTAALAVGGGGGAGPVLMKPESLLEPGFRCPRRHHRADRRLCGAGRQHLPAAHSALMMPVFTLVLSSLIGGPARSRRRISTASPITACWRTS